MFNYFLLLLLASAIAQPTAPGAPAPCTLFGADCSCSSNFTAFLEQVPGAGPATCASHTWTYNGDLSLTTQDWDIQTDTIQINGGLTCGPSSTVRVSLTPGDPTNSGEIFVQKQLLASGSIYFSLLTAPVGDWVMTVVDYTSIDPTQSFQANAPILPPGYTICRLFSSADPPKVSYAGTMMTLEVVIDQHPTVSCTDGRGPHQWAVAFMILLSIHAVCLLLFCLITCKKEDLKEKVWDTAY